MQKIFNNILVPIVLNRHAPGILEKAAAFSNKLDCHLHVVFVIRQHFFSDWVGRMNDENVKSRIQHLHHQYSFQLKKGLKLFTAIQKPGAENILDKYVELHEIDLVMVSGDLKNYVSRNRQSPSDSSGHLMHCPVLTLRSYPDIKECHTIVLPIGNYLPIQKLRVAIFMAKHFNAEIHLVAGESDQSAEQDSCMQRAFRVLKDNTGLEVRCNRLPGKDLSKVAGRYAASVSAALVLMDPEYPGSVKKILSKLVPIWPVRVFKVPVITMS